MNCNIRNKRVKRFEEICHTKLLEDYYGIKNTDTRKLKIKHLRTRPNKIYLDICFENARYYDFINLPQELSRIISEYVPTVINIRIEIAFPNDYPFRRPIYSLMNVEHNVSNSPVILEEYYKYIVDNHNAQYKHYWSPVIEIQKDILDFIRKINHFEYLFG